METSVQGELPDAAMVEREINLIRRRMVVCRDPIVVRDLAQGWVSLEPGAAPGAVPSASANRMMWLSPRGPLTRGEVDEAIGIMREYGIERAYAWVSARVCDAAGKAMLREAGLTPWPAVQYVAFARRAGEVRLERESEMVARKVVAEECAGVLERCAGWYGEGSAKTMERMVKQGISEMFAAFHGTTPVAMGFLSVGKECGYIGGAGTAPEWRGKGAQGALIAARVKRTAELGATWAVCETNTMVPISIRNLTRAGFKPVLAWGVLVWNEAAKGA